MNWQANSHRKPALLVCMLAVAACLAYAWFRNVLPDWWRESGGGIPYVVFWCAFGFVFLPLRRAVLPICVTATLVTCGLEFLQLWQPPWLTQLRGSRFGAALLGNDFAWSDLPPYFIGGAVGFALLTLITSIGARRGREERAGDAETKGC